MHFRFGKCLPKDITCGYEPWGQLICGISIQIVMQRRLQSETRLIENGSGFVRFLKLSVQVMSARLDISWERFRPISIQSGNNGGILFVPDDCAIRVYARVRSYFARSSAREPPVPNPMRRKIRRAQFLRLLLLLCGHVTKSLFWFYCGLGRDSYAKRMQIGGETRTLV